MSKTKQELIQEFLTISDFTDSTKSFLFPKWNFPSFGLAIKEYIKSKNIKVIYSKAFSPYDGKELLPEILKTQVGFNEYVYLPSSVSYFCEEGNNKFILEIDLHYSRQFGIVTLFSKEKEEASNLKLKELESLADSLNVFRKKLITGMARFLERKNYKICDLFLKKDVIESVNRNITSFFSKSDLYKKFKLPNKRGILISGKPGVGKTLLGKILASQLKDTTFIWVTGTDVLEVGDFSYIMNMARTLKPSIVFIEDIDLLGESREQVRQRGHMDRDIQINEVLNQLDGQVENDDIMVIATTNFPELLDPALVNRPNRFDVIIEFNLPDYNTRASFISYLLGKYDLFLPDSIFKKFVESTEGISPSHIQEIVRYAMVLALEKGSYDEKKLWIEDSLFKSLELNIPKDSKNSEIIISKLK